MQTAITYGTFDTFHWGHIEILKRAKAQVDGGKLIVGLSTDEFNSQKGKHAYHSFSQRKTYLESIKYVDLVIPEESWGQKESDIKKYEVDVLVMGDDWKNSEQFNQIKRKIVTKFLPRTKSINSTDIRELINKESL